MRWLLEKALRLGVALPDEVTNADDSPINGDFNYRRLRDQLESLNCENTIKALDRMHDHTEQGMATKEAFARLHYLQSDYISRLHDEIASKMLLFLTMKEAGYYEYPLEGWEDVVDAFPSTAFEITEASKCYALNRYDATVFHIMRAVEVGILALLSSINKPMSNGNWGAYIEAIEKHARTQSPPVKKGALEDVAAHLRTVKNAWRNPTMHVENRYSETEASRIYEASKGLLQSISKAI